ncbi:nucleotidyltransferase family protein [Caenimonas aquaedulcis]|uniref:nucleotidyltransferase family protein n=1 Tax=Caenimonas aquaedulcis TaxID=2793270 RepID=UPI003390045E
MSGPAVLVLASGRGERFKASGGTGSKLEAMLFGKTVLDRTLDAVRASGLRWHLEDKGHPGMGDSIAAAVHATRDASGWLILPGDLPLVQAATLSAVAQAVASHAVVLPRYGGRQGHPVGFGSACRDALLDLTGPLGASTVVRAQRDVGGVFTLDIDDPGIVTDIDTVDDLARAEALLLRR